MESYNKDYQKPSVEITSEDQKVLDFIFEGFKSKKHNTIKFTNTELKLIRVVIDQFLYNVKDGDDYNIGCDIDDNIRNSLMAIERIYEKISNYLNCEE